MSVVGDDLVPSGQTVRDIEQGSAGRRVQITVTPAAAAHLEAWAHENARKALHEAAHAVAATVLGFRVTSADIKGRDGGSVTLGIDDDDTPRFELASKLTARIVVALAGHAIERLVLGEPTSGSADDLQKATHLALRRFDEGFDPDAPLINVDGFYSQWVPDAVVNARGDSAVRTLAAAREQADALVAEHRDQVIALARHLYPARRLSDDALAEAIRSVGLDPVPLEPE